jgi:hypothetical protein
VHPLTTRTRTCAGQAGQFVEANSHPLPPASAEVVVVADDADALKDMHMLIPKDDGTKPPPLHRLPAPTRPPPPAPGLAKVNTAKLAQFYGTSEEDVEKAVLKIQSMRRGQTARRNVFQVCTHGAPAASSAAAEGRALSRRQMQNVKSWGNVKNVIADSMQAREPSVGKKFGWTRRKEALMAVYMTVWLYIVALCLAMPVLPFYVRYLGASNMEVGILFSLCSLLRGLSAFAMAKLSDRFGRRPLLLVALTGVVVGFLLSAFAYNFMQLVLAQCVFSAFAACDSISVSFVSDLVREHERAKAFNTCAPAAQHQRCTGCTHAPPQHAARSAQDQPSTVCGAGSVSSSARR